MRRADAAGVVAPVAFGDPAAAIDAPDAVDTSGIDARDTIETSGVSPDAPAVSASTHSCSCSMTADDSFNIAGPWDGFADVPSVRVPGVASVPDPFVFGATSCSTVATCGASLEACTASIGFAVVSRARSLVATSFCGSCCCFEVADVDSEPLVDAVLAFAAATARFARLLVVADFLEPVFVVIVE